MSILINSKVRPGGDDALSLPPRPHERAFWVSAKWADILVCPGSHRVDDEPSSVVTVCDALALEGPFLPRNDGRADPRIILAAVQSSEQFVSPLSAAAAEGKKVFLVDVTNDSFNERGNLRQQLYIALAEGYVGYRLAKNAVSNLQQRKPSTPKSRRNFLRQSVKATAGIWLGSELLSYGMAFAAEAKPFSSILNNAALYHAALYGISSSRAVHPELGKYVVEFRNLVMAQKLYAVSQRLKHERRDNSQSERKPRIALQLGLAHGFIGKELQRSSAQRCADLKRGLGAAYNMEAVYGALTFRHDGTPSLELVRDRVFEGV